MQITAKLVLLFKFNYWIDKKEPAVAKIELF